MSRLVVLVVLAMALAFALPDSTEATSLNEVRKLTASDAEADEYFGRAVAISIDTVVVGAQSREIHQPFLPFALAGGGESAYIFHRDQGGAGNWGEVTKLIASDAQAEDWFGRSVALSDNTVIVGAYLEDAGGSAAGAAYIFQRNEGGVDNWGEVRKLTASDAQANDFFGISVAVDADTAIVSSVFEDSGGSSSGAAYIFHRDEGGADNWGEVKKITASDAEANDLFGRGVAVSGDFVVVGAPDEDAAGSDAGAAYVFQQDEGGTNNWGEAKKITPSDAQSDDQFGNSVAASGDTAVVGAVRANGLAGAAYVFQRDEGGANNWGELKKLTASDADTFDLLGASVTISGDTALVGAPKEGAGGFNAGAAYLFRRGEGGTNNWGEVVKLTASNAEVGDNFSFGVAVSGDIAVVGALQEGTAAFRAGAAYVFDLSQPKPTPSDTPTVTITPTPTATLTPTPSATPCPSGKIPTPNGCILQPVGGISLDSDLRALPLETTDPDGSAWGIAGVVVAVTSIAALGGAAWYARRRRRFA